VLVLVVLQEEEEQQLLGEEGQQEEGEGEGEEEEVGYILWTLNNSCMLDLLLVHTSVWDMRSTFNLLMDRTNACRHECDVYF
jgi:hypothetical protein